MSKRKLTLGGGVGNPGFSMPSPYYDRQAKRYRSGGVVWVRRQPATPEDIDAWVDFLVSSNRPRSMAERTKFDSLSLKGKGDKNYGSMSTLGRLQGMTHAEILKHTQPVSVDEAKKICETNAAASDLGISIESETDGEIMAHVERVMEKQVSGEDMTEVEAMLVDAFVEH